MQIEDVHRKPPAEHQEARHLGPQAVADDQRIGTDIEWRCRAELAAPESDGADVPEIFIQHVGHHAEHVRKIAVVDLIFEIDDDDGAKAVLDPRPHHDQVLPRADQAEQCRMIVGVDGGAAERDLDQLLKCARRPFRIGKGIGVARAVDLVALDAFRLARGDLHPQRLGFLAGLERRCVPRVVQVLRGHDAEEEVVVGLRRKRQTLPLDLLRGQVLHRDLLIDQVQHVPLLALDRDGHEAQLGRPIVLF